MTGYWDLIKDEVYSRDVSGKEVALYVNGNLMQNNIWGLGNEGYITSSGALNFFSPLLVFSKSLHEFQLNLSAYFMQTF